MIRKGKRKHHENGNLESAIEDSDNAFKKLRLNPKVKTILNLEIDVYGIIVAQLNFFDCFW